MKFVPLDVLGPNGEPGTIYFNPHCTLMPMQLNSPDGQVVQGTLMFTQGQQFILPTTLPEVVRAITPSKIIPVR